MSIPNGQSTQQRMNIIGVVVTTSKSNQHRTFYQAPSPRDYESLMKLCEACNFYIITVPVGVLLLSILEIIGLSNTLSHISYIILSYSTLLCIHEGLFGHL
ncbi:2285_t:CDS:2 [Ambispora leptoticha]|uniref:2285_t:CDS:1 n=1 Tax=Ambispora leptoticha TaxID=144679 RepID=A0A9N9CFD8_9GLOM|nr:2285_t:CDS:2 [Ambispora leptoticha]